MRKTVLFLEQQSWRGGAQRVLEAVLNALPADCAPLVAFPDPGPFRTALEQRGVRTLTFPLGAYRSGRKSGWEMVVFGVRSALSGLLLARTIRRERVALVYVNGPRCLPAGTLAAWLTGRPSVFHLHLVLTRPPELRLAAFLARRVSRVAACSPAAADALLRAERRLSGKIRVLYNPAPGLAPARRKAPGGAAVTVGVVGRITESKGQDLLLHAVAGLPAPVRERIRLVVLGAPAPQCAADERYAAHLRDLARRHGLEAGLVWAGYQSDPAPGYAAMDVLVHPARAEALCLAILEALEQGIPVIATRTGDVTAVVRNGDNGLLTPPGDVDALRAALRRFVEDAALRARLEAGARAGLDRRFSLEAFGASVRALIGELGGAPPRAGASTWDPAAWR